MDFGAGFLVQGEGASAVNITEVPNPACLGLDTNSYLPGPFQQVSENRGFGRLNGRRR